jgi:uncharacterized protein with ATP-grasp and redox domains
MSDTSWRHTFGQCEPCFLSQARRYARLTTGDEVQVEELVQEIEALLSNLPYQSSPSDVARAVYERLEAFSPEGDPYKPLKSQHTQQALTLYGRMKEKIRSSADPLLAAIRIAIAGNIIDFGPQHEFDIQAELENIFEQPFAVCDYEAFKVHLQKAENILYFGDNAGETVFDRALIEELAKPTTFVVRGKPMINDAVLSDAVEAGIDRVATILSTGSSYPGILLDTCSKDLVRAYHDADLVISKGMGNYESLHDEKRTIFFLFRAKCEPIARHAGVQKGDILLKAIHP